MNLHFDINLIIVYWERRSKMKKRILPAMLILFLAMNAGCASANKQTDENKESSKIHKTADKASSSLDKTANEAGKGLENAAAKTGQALDTAAKKTGIALEKAWKKVKGWVEE
jgi:hypothetical protein